MSKRPVYKVDGGAIAGLLGSQTSLASIAGSTNPAAAAYALPVLRLQANWSAGAFTDSTGAVSDQVWYHSQASDRAFVASSYINNNPPKSVTIPANGTADIYSVAEPFAIPVKKIIDNPTYTNLELPASTELSLTELTQPVPQSGNVQFSNVGVIQAIGGFVVWRYYQKTATPTFETQFCFINSSGDVSVIHTENNFRALQYAARYRSDGTLDFIFGDGFSTNFSGYTVGGDAIHISQSAGGAFTFNARNTYSFTTNTGPYGNDPLENNISRGVTSANTLTLNIGNGPRQVYAGNWISRWFACVVTVDDSGVMGGTTSAHDLSPYGPADNGAVATGLKYVSSTGAASQATPIATKLEIESVEGFVTQRYLNGNPVSQFEGQEVHDTRLQFRWELTNPFAIPITTSDMSSATADKNKLLLLL